MADVHTVEGRSFNMSRIKGKNTKPELLVRKFLFNNGFRYRLHRKTLPGKPDIVLTKYRTVIFVNGCFWHGHQGCKYYVIPKTRTNWWVAKIERNKERDAYSYSELRKLGWKVITLFECQLKPKVKDKTLNALIRNIH